MSKEALMGRVTKWESMQEMKVLCNSLVKCLKDTGF